MLFCLCHRCAKEFKKKNTRISHICNHTREERAFTATLTHMEIKEALRNNYVIDRFYRAWNYKEFSDSIFKDYVRTFIKLKVEASGPPKNFTNEEIDKFIMDYFDHLGVKIDKNNLIDNPSLRYIAKIVGFIFIF